MRAILVDETASVSDQLYMAIRPMLAVSAGSLWWFQFAADLILQLTDGRRPRDSRRPSEP